MVVCFDHADSFELDHKPRSVSNFEAYENIQNVFKILIVQIPCRGRTLELTKAMNDQILESCFQVKGETFTFC